MMTTIVPRGHLDEPQYLVVFGKRGMGPSFSKIASMLKQLLPDRVDVDTRECFIVDQRGAGSGNYIRDA